HSLTLYVNRLASLPINAFAAMEFGRLNLQNFIKIRFGNLRLFNYARIADHFDLPTDTSERAHCQFGLVGQAKFAHHQNIEWGSQDRGDGRSHWYTTARKSKYY